MLVLEVIRTIRFIILQLILNTWNSNYWATIESVMYINAQCIFWNNFGLSVTALVLLTEFSFHSRWITRTSTLKRTSPQPRRQVEVQRWAWKWRMSRPVWGIRGPPWLCFPLLEVNTCFLCLGTALLQNLKGPTPSRLALPLRFRLKTCFHTPHSLPFEWIVLVLMWRRVRASEVKRPIMSSLALRVTKVVPRRRAWADLWSLARGASVLRKCYLDLLFEGCDSMKIKSVNNVHKLYALGVELSSWRKISVFI